MKKSIPKKALIEKAFKYHFPFRRRSLLSCGYTSLPNFLKAFKIKYGITRKESKEKYFK